LDYVSRQNGRPLISGPRRRAIGVTRYWVDAGPSETTITWTNSTLL